MPAVMIRRRRSYDLEQWMVVVADEYHVIHGRTTSRNGQATYCRRCCASQTTKVDGRPLQRRWVSEYPNDAWASRVLVSYTTCDRNCLLLFSGQISMRWTTAHSNLVQQNLLLFQPVVIWLWYVVLQLVSRHRKSGEYTMMLFVTYDVFFLCETPTFLAQCYCRCAPPPLPR